MARLREGLQAEERGDSSEEVDILIGKLTVNEWQNE